MSRPATAQLTSCFSVEPFGGDITLLADINGDGRQELLILQSAGNLGQECFRQRDDVDDVDRALFCLTAVTLEGNVLWQIGTPYDREMPFTGHGGGWMLGAADVDADGAAEVLMIRHGRLCILNGATGEERQSIELPADNFKSATTAQLGPPEAGRQIICRVKGQAEKPWRHGNPTVIYNPDLSVYKEPFEVRGAGHNVVAMDVNGDGRDELFIGYSMLDHQANELWRLDMGPDFDYEKDHADQIAVSDLNGDGNLVVRYAGSEDFFVADLRGNLLWRTHAGHSQTSVEGAWGPNGEKRIIMSEKNRGLWGLDTAGNILWNRTDLNGYARANVRWRREGPGAEWALFRPQLKQITPTPYQSDPAWSETLWPRFLDGDGTPFEVFPWEEDYRQPQAHIRARRSYDCGVLYNVLMADLDDDGLDEILIHDRRRVWLFHSPE